MEAVGNADQPTPALLVGLGAAQAYPQPLGDQLQVLDVQAGELGAPEAAGEAEQQRPVANPPARALGDGGEGFPQGWGISSAVLPLVAAPWVRRTPATTARTPAVLVGEGYPAAW